MLGNNSKEFEILSRFRGILIQILLLKCLFFSNFISFTIRYLLILDLFGGEISYIRSVRTQGRFDIDISYALSFVWFHSGDRRFTVELFMEKSKLAACGLMRFRGAFSKPLRELRREESRLIRVHAGEF